MATISELTEDFTVGATGAAISISNTIFVDGVFGTGTAVFAVDPIGTSLKVMDVTSSANFRNGSKILTTPTALLWFVFDLEPVTLPTVNTAIFNAYDSAATPVKLMDIQITPTGTLRLRDANTQVAVSGALDTTLKHRVYVRIQPTAAGTGTMQMKIYSGSDNTALTYDSASQTVSTPSTGLVGTLNLGVIGSSTMHARFGRLRGDNASQPVPPSSGTVTLSANTLSPLAGSTVTVTATVGGTGTLTWTATGATLSGTGNTRTFTAPAAGSQVTVTASYGGASDSVTTTSTAPAATISLGPDQLLVEPGTIVVIPVTTTGTGTLVFTQTAGPTTSLSGSGATQRTFMAMPTINASGIPQITTYTFQATYGGAVDSVTITVNLHNRWKRLAAGGFAAVLASRYS